MFTDFYPLSTHAWVFLSVEITVMESLKRQEDILVSTFPSSLKRNVLWVDGDDVLINNHSCISRERSSKVLGSPSLTTCCSLNTQECDNEWRKKMADKTHLPKGLGSKWTTHHQENSSSRKRQGQSPFEMSKFKKSKLRRKIDKVKGEAGKWT